MLPIDAVIGTRPEVIKAAPIVVRLLHDRQVRVTILLSGQQRELVWNALEDLRLSGAEGFSIICLSSRERTGFDPAWRADADRNLGKRWSSRRGHCVLVFGDTDTALLGARLASELDQYLVHVEGGIRHSRRVPVEPEEINRQRISSLANFHLVPTETEKSNLVAEGISEEAISVIGDLSIAAVAYAESLLENTARRNYDESRGNSTSFADVLSSPYVVVTLHRPLSRAHSNGLVLLLTETARLLPSHSFLFLRRPDSRWDGFYDQLKRTAGFRVAPALPPTSFVALLKRCSFVITDSAGVQQEAIILKKHVIALRNDVELYRSHRLLHIVSSPYSDLPDLGLMVSHEAAASYRDGDDSIGCSEDVAKRAAVAIDDFATRMVGGATSAPCPSGQEL